MCKKILNKNIVVYFLNFFLMFILVFSILFLFSSYDSYNDKLLNSVVIKNEQYYQFECKYNSIERLGGDDEYDYEQKYSHNTNTRNELKAKGIDSVYMTFGHNSDYSKKFNIYFVDDESIGLDQFAVNNDLFYSLGEPKKIDKKNFYFSNDISEIEFSLSFQNYKSEGVYLNSKVLDKIKFNVIKDYYPLNFGGVINFISLSYAISKNYVSTNISLNDNELINLTNYNFDGIFYDNYLNEKINKYFDDTYIDFDSLLGFNDFKIVDIDIKSNFPNYLVVSDNVFNKISSKINPYCFATKCSNENRKLLSSDEYYVYNGIDNIAYTYLEKSVRTNIFNFLIPILIIVLIIYVYFFNYVIFYKNKNDLVVLFTLNRNAKNGQFILNFATFIVNIFSCLLASISFYSVDYFLFPKNCFGYPDYIFGWHCIIFTLSLVLFFVIALLISVFVYKKKINYLSVKEVL